MSDVRSMTPYSYILYGIGNIASQMAVLDFTYTRSYNSIQFILIHITRWIESIEHFAHILRRRNIIRSDEDIIFIGSFCRFYVLFPALIELKDHARVKLHGVFFFFVQVYEATTTLITEVIYLFLGIILSLDFERDDRKSAMSLYRINNHNCTQFCFLSRGSLVLVQTLSVFVGDNFR